MANICYNCFRYMPEGSESCPFCGYDSRRDGKQIRIALRPGTPLANRYVIGRALGQGGFGVTYVALDSRTRIRVAIKEYLPTEFVIRSADGTTLTLNSDAQRDDFESGKTFFLEEARTLAQFVGYEHIVGIHSYFEANGTAYFAMEYIDGINLKQYLMEKTGTLSVHEANRILLPIMETLQWIHAKGIVHRDIAPDNIMIKRDGTAKLIDFGAARYSTGEKSKSLDVILKHGFAPYEQYSRRGRQGPFTDVYAMAATYYYTVTGKLPQDAIDRMSQDELVLPSALNVQIRKSTEQVLSKALSVNAQDRYQNMTEFYSALLETTMPDPFSPDAEYEYTRQERAYQAACKAQRSAKTESDYKSVIRQFEKLQDYRESKEHLQECETAVTEIRRTERERREAIAEEEAKAQITKKTGTSRSGQEPGKGPDDPGATLKKRNRRILAIVVLLAIVIGVMAIGGDRILRRTDIQTTSDGSPEPTTEIASPDVSPSDVKEPDNAEEPEETEQPSLPEDTETDGTGEATTEPVMTVPLESASVGDVVLFGSYEQDNDPVNGAEPIEWIVLRVDGDESLLLSKDALDCVPYNKVYGSITWTDSSIRRWLNNDFLNKAFTKEQQAKILQTRVDNSNAQINADWGSPGGADTKDNVFLLSYAEALALLDGVEIKGQATPYAISRGAAIYAREEANYGNCWWWLRSPGTRGYNAAGVRYDGIIVDELANYTSGAVRPAMWVDTTGAMMEVELLAASQAGPGSSGADAPETGISLVSGDYHTAGSVVRFGTYEQNNNAADGQEGIDWIVLEWTSNNHVLLLSADVLDCRPFNIWGDAQDISWENSSLRTWLNDGFCKMAFSEADQEAIVLTPIDNSHYQSYGEYLHRDWKNTEDHVFLLSYKEAYHYFGMDLKRTCRATGYAKAFGLYINKDSQCCGWWLRSPGNDNQDVSYISPLGYISSAEINSPAIGNGVRPAIWLDLNVLGIRPDNQDRVVDTSYGAVGTTVHYGHYEQDNDQSNGPEEIEWLVLDADGDCRLMISKYGLTASKFHGVSMEVPWGNSQLRNWLNEEFYETAFTEEEQRGIPYTITDNSNRQFYVSIDDENKSQDKLYLLSYTELVYYFPSASDRICEITAYAKAQNSSAAKWWLRTPGQAMSVANYVDAQGNRKDEAVVMVNYVRPVMWVDIHALEGNFTDERTYRRADFADVGHVVKFGQYEQDNRSNNGPEDIEWIVLETDGETSLLISRVALDRRQYHNVNEDLLWEDSELRSWLNGTFYHSAFREEEQNAVAVSTVSNSKDEWYYNMRAGKDTQDKVYVLSYREAWTYFRRYYERSTCGSAYANRNMSKPLSSWWLRSPGRSYNFVNIVDGFGSMDNVYVRTEDILVRPVIRVDLNAAIFQN